MKNYFHILGLEPGASDDEIRKAYRNLAKKYHPDVNQGNDTREKFVEVHQAYSFLLNTSQRKNYERLLAETKMTHAEQEHRERIYKLWVEHQQQKARTRDVIDQAYHSYKQSSQEEKIWNGLNTVYNVFILLLFTAMVFIPIKTYIDELSLPEEEQRSFFNYLIPSVICAGFVGYGFYFWFILKTDKD